MTETERQALLTQWAKTIAEVDTFVQMLIKHLDSAGVPYNQAVTIQPVEKDK